MKKFTTFLSVLALMLVSAAANAQSFANGDYFFQNVETGTWLGGANDWGTHASVVAHPQRFTLSKVSDGVYTLDSHTYNASNKHFLNADYVDGTSTNITIAPVAGKEGVYTLASGSNYYTTDGNYVWQAADADPASTKSQWKVISEADMIKNLKIGETTDATFFIKGASISRNLYNKSFESVWTVVAANCNLGGGDYKNMCAESWRSNNGFNVYQTITVPNGVYKLKAQAAMNNYDNLTANLPAVYANDESVEFANITGGESSMSAMSTSFSAGKYVVEVPSVKVTDNKLTVGVKSTLTTIWAIWDNFELELVEYLPQLGEPVFTPADGSSLAPSALTSFKVSYPKAEVDEKLGFSVNAEWILYEDGKEIKSGEGAFDVAGQEIPFEAGVGHTYSIEVTPTINKPDGTTADTRTDNASVKTLTTTELAIAEYEEAVEDAEVLSIYADSHRGTGLMLYLPAKVDQYIKNLEWAKDMIGTPTNIIEASEGVDIIRGLMAGLTPQYPKLNQRYIIQQKSSGLYMNVADDKVTLAAAPTPVMFHHVEGADIYASFYMYSTPDRKYVYYTGNNTWSLTGQKTSLELGQWVIRHDHESQAYNLIGANGALGSDATDAASALYGNKDKYAANSMWLITPYTEPELSEEDLTNGDYFIRNRETGTYLGGANSWGTQASLIENGNAFTATLITDGVYTLDSHIYNNASNHFLGNGGFVDQAATNLTITSVGNGYYTIGCDDKFYSAPASGNVAVIGENAGAKSEWEFLTKQDLLDEVAAGSNDNLTFLLKDPNFSRNCLSQETNPWDIAPSKGGDNANMNAEKWGGNSQEFDSHQTVEIPNGIYRISCQGYYRYNNTTENTNQVAIDAHADGTEVINSYLYANEVSVPLKSIADDAAVAALSEIPFSQAAASAAFNQGLYQNEVIVKVTNGKLTLGIKKTSHPGCDWTVWDNFQIHTSSAAEAALFNAYNPAVEPEATAISSAATSAAATAIYSANGAQLKSLQKGLNIVKMSDGSVKKIMVK